MPVWAGLEWQRPLLRIVARRHYSSHQRLAAPAFDPLRILFCGSDNFSIASLDALVSASKEEPSFIQSVEVVARPGKWTGHKRKIFKEVPITDRARCLGLPLHHIDTFRGWTPQAHDGSSFNLILAVSFGLLIPHRIIEGARYGGLNVHPSMLPDLWGAAPLQHALLDGDKHIGLTVQTLHPTKMDNGAILAQTANPGIEIPFEAQQSFSALVDYVAPLGAKLLVDTLKQGLFQSPITDLAPEAVSKLQGREPRHARKLVLEDRHIDWDKWSAHKIVHHQKLLTSLWNTIQTSHGIKRLVWTGDFELVTSAKRDPSFPPGVAYALDDNSMLINTVGDATLRVYDCTIARDQSRNIHRVAQRLGLVKDWSSRTKSFISRFD